MDRLVWMCGFGVAGVLSVSSRAVGGSDGLGFEAGRNGLSIGGEYVAEWGAVVSGGVSRSGSFRNMLTVDAELDLGEAFGIEGGTLFAQYLSVNPEHGGSRDAGDIQVYTNLENDYHLDVLYELWYEQVLLGGGLRLKIGKVDANTEFANVEIAGEFSNSSAGFSPTIFGLPTYPDPAAGVNLFANLVDRGGVSFTLGYGVYDGAAAVDGVRTGNRGPATMFSSKRSDDLFHIAQGELEWDSIGRFGAGRLTVGVWHHTGDFERFDGGEEDGAAGLFLTFEQQVSGRSQGRGAYVFAQYGWTDDRLSEIGQHLAGGVVTMGTFPGRDDDSAGVYLSYADLSDAEGAGFEGDEFVIDAYYRVRVNGSVYVQPEIQYIARPSGGAGAGDALVVGLRVGIGF